jgi:hypothetical protein
MTTGLLKCGFSSYNLLIIEENVSVHLKFPCTHWRRYFGTLLSFTMVTGAVYP